MASTNDMRYTGHGANTGGLQLHSIGDTYPWISVVVGTDRETRTYHYLNGATGEVGPSFRKSAHADQWLRGTLACRAALEADRALKH